MVRGGSVLLSMTGIVLFLTARSGQVHFSLVIAGMIGAIDDVIAEYAHIGERGAIVSMPIRHSVLVHPIDDSTVRPAIAGMIPITRQLFKQGPGSVSPHLYWWRDGALEWIPTFFDGTPSGVEVYPSSELSDLVADLTR